MAFSSCESMRWPSASTTSVTGSGTVIIRTGVDLKRERRTIDSVRAELGVRAPVMPEGCSGY